MGNGGDNIVCFTEQIITCIAEKFNVIELLIGQNGHRLAVMWFRFTISKSCRALEPYLAVHTGYAINRTEAVL